MDVTGNRINTIAANSVTTTQGATNLQPTSATLTNLSSVSITKKFDPNPVSPGGISRLTLTIKKIGIGIGLTGLGVTDTLPEGLTIAGTPASTNTCGGTLSAPTDGTFIQLTGGTMPIGMTTCTIAVSIMASETGIARDGYNNCIPAGTIVTDQGYTNIMEACDNLGTIFDPPTGIKVLNAVGLPELEWRMVWINNHNSTAINVQINDPIPTGTTYVADSLNCQVVGSSTTTTCEYNAGTQSVFWQGDIGEDRGATNEDTAENEVIITFRVTVPNTVNSVNNRATSLTDTNGDGEFTDETTSSSRSNSNIARWSRFPRRSNSGSDGNDASILPNSGFAPNIITILPEKPADLYSSYPDLEIEIPSLGLNTEIVGLPLIDKKWDVSWLGNQLGYLEETAFPTWNGNSVITGHVYDANGQPGPFINLKNMRYGEQVIVSSYGQRYRFEVREVLTVAPDDIKAALKHQEQPWITLLTCQGYDEKVNSYASRVLVRAVLVEVEQ
jgi:LPXTG-site transpeptidase (sortase) family protein